MEKNYYIVNDAFTTNPQDLKIGSRIITTPINFNENFVHGEGPFKTRKEVTSKSNIYKKLKNKDLSRAQKIVNNIFFAKGYIRTPDIDIDQNTINALIHSVKGRIKNKNITGVHFFDDSKIRITKFVNFNLDGVFETYFEFYNIKTDKWVSKKITSTFFPKNWTVENLFNEVSYAINNIKITKNGNYNSLTLSKTKVIIYVKEGKVKTIYPII